MTLMVQYIERLILSLSGQVPLEFFVLAGSLAEEVITPIPSVLIMTTAGLLARSEGHTTFFLVWLVMIGNLGKLLGTLGWYVIGDKLEDVVVGRLGRWFGLTHQDVERVGSRFSGHAWRDGLTIFFLRAIPFFPSLAVSLASGVIKLRLRTFLVASYLGGLCKDSFYIAIGYFGIRAFRTFILEIERVRLGLGILIALGGLLLLVLAYRKRQQGRHLLVRAALWIREWFRQT